MQQYAEYEQVVVEDRIEKEKSRRKVDQEAREIAAAIKVTFILLCILWKLILLHTDLKF